MKFIIKYLFVFLPVITVGQNLVPNGSFEDTLSCPTGGGFNNLSYTTGWFNPNTASPDLFHSCNTSDNSVPINYFGNQLALTGNAYAGIISYSAFSFGVNYREYIEIELTEELKKDKEYCIEFYVSLADESMFVSDNLAVYFSNDSIVSDTSINLQITPQVQNITNNFITDKTNWTLIRGGYIATGGEKFITIGNFYPDSLTNIITVNGTNNYAYYYIDDVSVIEMPDATASAGTDTTICEEESVAIGTPAQPNYSYSWQPAENLSNASIAQPIATPAQTITYYLTVTDTSFGGNCSSSATDSVTITVKQNCDSVGLTIPNIFTPNGDGTNDVFKVQAAGITELNATIYNRWGKKVYEWNSLQGFWDGRTAAGMEVPGGVYYYVLSYKGVDGIEETSSGIVQLIR